MGKVRYGFEKLYYATLEDDGSYGTPTAWPGAVSFTAEPQGETSSFAADNNGSYATFTTNSGYELTLEVADVPESVYTDVYGDKKDGNGAIVENSDAQPKHIALLYMVKGNEKDQRFVFYDVTLSRPSLSANTTSEDSTDPDTVSIDATAALVEKTLGSDVIKTSKASLELSTTSKTAYDAWFTKVYEPVASA